MERRILEPEQIIASEYDVGNESILKIYFRIFDKGHGSDLPPPIVIRKDLVTGRALELFSEDQSDAQRLYSELRQPGADYFLIDGNHRAVAAALCHVAPNVLELETDQDLNEVRKMVEGGGLFDFPHTERRLSSIADEFVRFLFRRRSSNYFGTLQERIDALISNGDLPRYMTQKYLKEKY
ncbi:hypothetical protein HYU22_00980 [Candidatus Woesearchaeota archaeon]|nr:hypothetical protein [Candidatus Woesearchaeota archaeon]